ncbi:MAG TPA: outer membrane beta-barrel protein [Methylomirabilota bacterium]|nr:outer membrane beta-barrel protein [Methylomirabilota bacterium]
MNAPKHPPTRRHSPAWMTLIAILLMPALADAQYLGRSGSLDIYGTGGYMDGDTARYSDFGVRLDVDGTAVGGIGAAYHFTDHVSLGFELRFGEMRISSRGASPDTADDFAVADGRLNVEYQVLATRFTPVLAGGIGFFSFSHYDDDVICFTDSTGRSFCFYDTTHRYEVNFAGNVGVGFRWDVTDHLFLKVMGGSTWTRLEDSDGHVRFDHITASIGASF